MNPNPTTREQIINAIRARLEQMPRWPADSVEGQIQSAFARAAPPEVLADHVLSLPAHLQRELLKKCLPELLP